MSDFIFNEHGVCTNPVVIHQIAHKEYNGEVVVFKSPEGLWGQAIQIRVRFGNGAYRGTPPSTYAAKYKTMSEARKAGMEEYSEDLKRMLKEAKEWNMRVAAGDNMGGEENRQLSLF